MTGYSGNQKSAGTGIDKDVIGVFSKKQYEIDLPRIIAEATAIALPLAMLIIDIDDFKKVNDQVGHDGGDEVLRLIAGKADKSVGKRGSVYRWGGDEFVVLLPNHSLDEAAAMAQRLLFEYSQLLYPKSIAVTVTIGVSAWPIPVTDIQTLFAVADGLLLEGKKKGQKNKVHLASTAKAEIIGADEWRFILTLLPETGRAIPKHELLDYLIRSSCSLPFDRFGRRYRFPLMKDRSNLLQENEEDWIGARVSGQWSSEQLHEIARDGSARLIITQRYIQPMRAVQGDVLLHGVVHFWPFVTRFWKQFHPTGHVLRIRLDGIASADLSLESSLYYSSDRLISKVGSYQSDDTSFLAASGPQGLMDLLVQTFHNVVAAFPPPQGISKSDFKIQYLQHKVEAFLGSVRDTEPNDE